MKDTNEQLSRKMTLQEKAEVLLKALEDRHKNGLEPKEIYELKLKNLILLRDVVRRREEWRTKQTTEQIAERLEGGERIVGPL